MSRDDGDNPEFSLATGDDEVATQQALEEAFAQATAAPRPIGDDPGLSLLQDSVLGMRPNGESSSEPIPHAASSPDLPRLVGRGYGFDVM